MCTKCQKSSCGGGCSGGATASNSGNSQEQLANQLAELSSTVAQLQEDTKAFACGHPILLIENKDDIDQFDLDSGLGIDCWDGWAICNGQQHYSKKSKKNILTPNFTDRFIVQAGGQYAIDDQGGLDAVQLTVPELPSHNHGVTDPGHTHDITDPGHLHAISDDMHTHQAVAAPHRHEAHLAMGSHTHNVRDHYQDDARLGAVTAAGIGVVFSLNSDPDLAGSVTIASSNETYDTETTDNGTGGTADGFTDLETVAIEISPAATGIEVLEAFTGIHETELNDTDITINNTGGDVAHENRPPFFACLYVIKLN